jgi:hypothetical protein
MSDEKTPPGGGFTWGLTPGGEPEKPEKSAEPKPAEGEQPKPTLDLGHFLALNQDEMIAAATEQPGTEQTGTEQTGPEPTAPAEPSAPAEVTPPAEPTLSAAASAPSFDDDEGEPTAAFDFRAPPPPPVDPIQAPVYHEGRALPWEQPPAIDDSLDGATEALSAEFVGLESPADESAPTSAIDSLFGDEKFQEYQPVAASALVPFVSRELVAVPAPNSPAAGGDKPPRGPLPKNQKVLMWVAGGLVAALALAGLFFVGTRVGDSMPAAVVTANATPTPTVAPAAPVAPVVAVGPVAPGVYEWKELLGTECVDPYVSAWEKEYTVVDCLSPHGGQLAYRGRFDDSALDPFPGVEALQARMNLLCASPENIDYAAASQFADIQIAASYAGTEDDWKSGNRNYYCFVSRSSGEPLTMSVAMPARAPVVIPVVPAPEP